MPRPLPTLLVLALPLVLAAGLAASCAKPDIHETGAIRLQACYNCHSGSYNAAVAPPHVNVLPTTCNDCHATTEWVPATIWTHPFFPLVGAHGTAACTRCHEGNPPAFVGVPTACQNCHMAAYNASTAPMHSSFPKTCGDCHTTSFDWGVAGLQPGRGEHPNNLFPISGGLGSHNNGIGCTDCHNADAGSPVKGQNCDCIHCHLGAHNSPAIDAVHASLGAAYSPTTNTTTGTYCLVCHPHG